MTRLLGGHWTQTATETIVIANAIVSKSIQNKPRSVK